MLKPQDIVIVLKLAAKNAAGLPWNFASLAKELCMSSSEVHAGYQRAVKATLINPHNRQPNIIALYEFLVHGLRYVFPAERGEITRGMPTAHAAGPLKNSLMDNNEMPPVWPYATGKVRGQSFLPLYKSVPKAAEQDEKLYDLLTLVDAVRGGRTRERTIAAKELQHLLGVT